MKPNHHTSFLNKANPDVSISIVSRMKNDDADMSINNFRRKKITVTTQMIRSDSKRGEPDAENKKEYRYLSTETMRKMLNKLLFKKKMSHKKIVQALNITIKELDRLLLYKEVTMNLIRKINLPLIMLYCETEWEKKPLLKPKKKGCTETKS